MFFVFFWFFPHFDSSFLSFPMIFRMPVVATVICRYYPHSNGLVVFFFLFFGRFLCGPLPPPPLPLLLLSFFYYLFIKCIDMWFWTFVFERRIWNDDENDICPSPCVCLENCSAGLISVFSSTVFFPKWVFVEGFSDEFGEGIFHRAHKFPLSSVLIGLHDDRSMFFNSPFRAVERRDGMIYCCTPRSSVPPVRMFTQYSLDSPRIRIKTNAQIR